MPDYFEILKLSHQLIHLLLLYPDEFLKAFDLSVLFSDPLLCPVQLLLVSVEHLLFELLDILLELVMLPLYLLLGYV